MGIVDPDDVLPADDRRVVYRGVYRRVHYHVSGQRVIRTGPSEARTLESLPVLRKLGWHTGVAEE